MLSDRTDALVARVNAVQADSHGAICGEDEADLLRNHLCAAKELLSQLQGHLSATEMALVDVRMQVEALGAEQVAQVSPYYMRMCPAHCVLIWRISGNDDDCADAQAQAL